MANFQDLVSLNASTLVHKGPQLNVGTSTASTVTHGFSNSGGLLALAASHSGNATVWMPNSGGTLLTNINISGGTTSSNVSAVTFSNANGVTFGFDGSNVSASIATSLTNINISAGTTSNNLSKITFSNSNGVSFGLNGSTMTASVATSLTNINVSAGTTSNNLSAVTFSNANGVSFGLNGSVVTASVAAEGVDFGGIAAGTQTATSGTVIFSNSNGVTFGMSGSLTVTASAVQSATCFSVLDFGTNNSISQASLSFQKVSVPLNVAATQMILMMDLEGVTNSSGALTISHAVYTINAGTASLASSATRQISWASGSDTSASSRFGGASGTRYRTVSCSYAFTPGDYLFGWIMSTSNAGTWVVFGDPGVSVVGVYDGIETAQFLNGTSNSSVTALPSSLAATNTNYARTGDAIFQLGMIFSGTGGA